jgi:hypothetical protein
MVLGSGARAEALGTALADGKQLLGAHFHAAQPLLAGQALAQRAGYRFGHALSSHAREFRRQPAGFLILYPRGPTRTNVVGTA